MNATEDHDEVVLRSALGAIADDADVQQLSDQLEQRIAQHRKRRAITISLGVAAAAAVAVVLPVTLFHHRAAAPTVGTAPTVYSSAVGSPGPSTPGQTSTSHLTYSQGDPVPQGNRSILAHPECGKVLTGVPVATPSQRLTMTSTADGPQWTVAGTNTTDRPVAWSIYGGNVIIVDERDRVAAHYADTLQWLPPTESIAPQGHWRQSYPNQIQTQTLCPHSATITPGKNARLAAGKYHATGISWVDDNYLVTQAIDVVVDDSGKMSLALPG